MKNGKLAYKAVARQFPDELKRKIAARKEDIIAHLQTISNEPQDVDDILPDVINRNQPVPCSFPQQRLWFIEQFSNNEAQYNIANALELKVRLNISALEKSIGKIIHRHEILRTGFEKIGNDVCQIIHPFNEFSLETIIFNEPSHQSQLLDSAVRKEASSPFKMDSTSLFRAKLFQLNDERFVLTLVFHHMVSDGWSLSIFVKELEFYYRSFCLNTGEELPSLPVHYADFSVWQRGLLQKGIFDAQLNYWKEQLGGMPQVHNFPLDKIRPAEQQFAGEQYEQILSAELLAQMKQVARQSGVTLFVFLQSALSLIHI